MDASDHELLRQFAARRGEDAFRALVDRHLAMVFSVARRVTGDPQLAEEVAQTTFVTLAQKAGELRPDDVPAGWLYHTARHLALPFAADVFEILAEVRRDLVVHRIGVALTALMHDLAVVMRAVC